MKKYIKPETDVLLLTLNQPMLVASIVIDDTPVDPSDADAREFIIGDDTFLFE